GGAPPPSEVRKGGETMSPPPPSPGRAGPSAGEPPRGPPRRAGLSLGEWLDSVIAESAGNAMPGPGRSADNFSALRGKIDALATRLGQLDAGALDARGRDKDIGQSLRGLEAGLADMTEDPARR